jgi:hypothetical protein
MPRSSAEPIRQAIADSRLPEALALLTAAWQGQEERLQNLILHLQERYTFLQNEMARGVISQADAELERAKITDGLLFLTNRLTNAQAEAPRHLQTILETPAKSKNRWMLYALTALILLVGSYFVMQLWSKPQPTAFDLKIRLQQPNNQPITTGKVELRIGERVFQARTVEADGRVIFENIPAALQHDSIHLIPLEMPFKIIKQSATTFVQSENGNISLILEPVVEWTNWRGTVFDKNGEVLTNIKLDIESGLASGTTDAQGNFRIRVPKATGETVQVILYTGQKQLYSRSFTLTESAPTQITIQ